MNADSAGRVLTPWERGFHEALRRVREVGSLHPRASVSIAQAVAVVEETAHDRTTKKVKP